MAQLEDIRSRVEIRNIGFEKVHFTRNPFVDFAGETHVTISVQYMKPDLETAPDADYAVRLRLELFGETDGEQAIHLDLVLSATFEINEEQPEIREILFQRNTLALMMPYMRAEVTLVTAQPGTVPIVLPAIDINRLVDGFVRIDGATGEALDE